MHLINMATQKYETCEMETLKKSVIALSFCSNFRHYSLEHFSVHENWPFRGSHPPTSHLIALGPISEE